MKIHENSTPEKFNQFFSTKPFCVVRRTFLSCFWIKVNHTRYYFEVSARTAKKNFWGPNWASPEFGSKVVGPPPPPPILGRGLAFFVSHKILGQAGRQTGRWSCGQEGRQAGRRAGRHACIHTFIYTCTCMHARTHAYIHTY